MPSPSFAPSAERVPASRIRALADVAFGMEDVLFLQFGESTLPTPPYVIEAVNRAAQEGWTFYSGQSGVAIAARRHCPTRLQSYMPSKSIHPRSRSLQVVCRRST